MLQPIYVQSSNKSRRSLRRGRILVCTRNNLDPDSTQPRIHRNGARRRRSVHTHVRRKPDYDTITTRLTGPREPPSDQSIFRPSPKLDKGKAKMSVYEEPIDNASIHSLDSEFEGLDIPIIQTDGAKKALESAKERKSIARPVKRTP